MQLIGALRAVVIAAGATALAAAPAIVTAAFGFAGTLGLGSGRSRLGLCRGGRALALLPLFLFGLAPCLLFRFALLALFFFLRASLRLFTLLALAFFLGALGLFGREPFLLLLAQFLFLALALGLGLFAALLICARRHAALDVRALATDFHVDRLAAARATDLEFAGALAAQGDPA